MKSIRNLRSLIVLALVLGAVVVAVAGIGCFGGGDEGTVSTVSIPPETEGSTTLVPGGAVSFDNLSSFRAKDPFKPQAVLITTTTAATTTTLPTTTTTRPPTTVTTRSTTTTVPASTTSTTLPHTLTCQAIYEQRNPPEVSFQIDSLPVVGAEVGLVLTGAYGRLEVTAIDVVSTPNTATFLRDDVYQYILKEGDYVVW